MGERRCDRCGCSGRHLCKPRASRVVDVFEELLVHTKGRWARSPFKLASWQRRDIIEPLFGTVEWSAGWERFVRSYRIAWIEMARKNGKSELLAGVALTLLCADDEDGAEIYGCARDVAQARKVYDVAERMVQLSPTLSKRCQVYRQAKRIVYGRTGSYYEVVPADAAGNLGHNPHGVIFDEVLTQPNRELWDAFTTALGSREQPLIVAATTAGDDDVGLCAVEHDYTERVLRQPKLDPRRFGYIRNTPQDADWSDPKVWKLANPALGTFKATTEMRDACRQAKGNPATLKAFRQFHLNTWGTAAMSEWVGLEAWDATAGVVRRDELLGRRCFAGLDLAAVSDLAAWCLTFPDEGGSYQALWRFWVPETMRQTLDARTGGQASVWASAGMLTFQPGDVLDTRALLSDVDRDARDFDIVDVAYDRWGMYQLAQEMSENGLSVVPMAQGYGSMSPPTKAWEALIRQGLYRHGGNEAMRWQFGNIRIRSDSEANIKIDKARSGDKVDGCVAAVMSLDRALQAAQSRSFAAAGFR